MKATVTNIPRQTGWSADRFDALLGLADRLGRVLEKHPPRVGHLDAHAVDAQRHLRRRHTEAESGGGDRREHRGAVTSERATG